MSIEAIWSMEFSVDYQGESSPAGQGMIVLEGGRAMGGDSGHTFIGRYQHHPDTGHIEACVRIKKYGAMTMETGFGPLDDFDLIVAGRLQENGTMQLRGYIDGIPYVDVSMAGMRRGELPVAAAALLSC